MFVEIVRDVTLGGVKWRQDDALGRHVFEQGVLSGDEHLFQEGVFLVHSIFLLYVVVLEFIDNFLLFVGAEDFYFLQLLIR